MQVLFQCEIHNTEINPNYFCTDQTNINQELTRNFYDSAEINLYSAENDIVIGKCLYSSVDCKKSVDFSKITQNISVLLSLDYEGAVGTFVVNYTVIDNEYLTVPNISMISSASGVFSAYLNYNVYITPSDDNPLHTTFIIYSESMPMATIKK